MAEEPNKDEQTPETGNRSAFSNTNKANTYDPLRDDPMNPPNPNLSRGTTQSDGWNFNEVPHSNGYSPEPLTPAKSGYNTAGLVLGIVTVVMACSCCCSFVGIVTGVLGIIFSVMGSKELKSWNGMGIAGLILSIAGLFLSVVAILVLVIGAATGSFETSAVETTFIFE